MKQPIVEPNTTVEVRETGPWEYELFLVTKSSNSIQLAHLNVRVSADGVDCYIDDLSTFDGHRNKGYATALLRYLDSWKVTASLQKTLTVYEENVPAVRLYEKLGYAKVIRIPNYTSIGEHMLVMSKNFGKATS